MEQYTLEELKMIDDIFSGRGDRYKIKGVETMGKNFDNKQIDQFTQPSQLQQQKELTKLKLNTKQEKKQDNISFADIKPKDPERKTKIVSVKVKPSVYDKALKKAKKQGFRSFNSFFNELLETYANS